MHEDFLNLLTRWIKSPPAQIATGILLAGTVWKFFERVEGIVSKDTKLRVSVWLLDIKKKRITEAWHKTFTRVFDRVFGADHLSIKCFLRSCIASYCGFLICWFIALSVGASLQPKIAIDPMNLLIELPIWKSALLYTVFLNVLPDYCSLLKTRTILRLISEDTSLFWLFVIIAVDLYLTACLASLAAQVGLEMVLRPVTDIVMKSIGGRGPTVYAWNWSGLVDEAIYSPFSPPPWVAAFWYYPAFFSSVWLWIYFASGSIIRAARTVRTGSDWFNRFFDIEDKPLQSLGFVGGMIVALVYWIAVLFYRYSLLGWLRL